MPVEPNQPRNVPVKIAGPGGNTFTSETPMNWGASEVLRRLAEAQAPERARLAAEQAKLAAQEQVRQREAAVVEAREAVRAYAAEVAQAVKAAAAANAKVGLPAALRVRLNARWLLGTRNTAYAPAFGLGREDPVLDVLVPLRDKVEWLQSHLPGLDDSGRLEIDRAEIRAHLAVLERARVVSGEQ
jgi:hypothetical protein